MGPHDRDRFDDLLDSALHQYVKVEPRAGLEGRVLANLAANAGRTRARSLWAWAVAGACAMVLVVAMWVGIGHRRPNTPAVAVQPNVTVKSVEKRAVLTPELTTPATKRARPRRASPPVIVAKAAEPRLEQFPSLRPLTQQELVIAEYVQQFPEEAKLMMQEQQKFDAEVQQAQQEVENSSRNSENQER
jgi:hypothetical protein